MLLLAHGAPERLEDVPEFLLKVRGGRALPEPAVQEIVSRYRMIGSSSPLLRLTNLQAEALSRVIALPVCVGMRNWTPSIPEAVRRLAAGGAEQVVAICLAPQNSSTSVGLYRKALGEALAQAPTGLTVDFVESWHDHPGFIAALAERMSAALTGASGQRGTPAPVIFTAHSVPLRTIAAGDPYERQVRETSALLAQSLRLPDYRVAFQSQGMTDEPWLGPTVEAQIDELAHAGATDVWLAPVGFVTDHVEILYDIDILLRDYARARGITVHRPESLNASPTFIAALASIVRTRLRAVDEGLRETCLRGC